MLGAGSTCPKLTGGSKVPRKWRRASSSTGWKLSAKQPLDCSVYVWDIVDPMVTPVNDPISLVLIIDSVAMTAVPWKLKWRGKEYQVKELGMAYSVRDGRKKVHVFQVNVGSLDMRLHVDGDSFHATLVETSDGLAD